MANTLVGSIVDGTYTKTNASTEATGSSSTTSSSLSAASTGTEYNQEMFLQLLVAEMQYQDPLEPTSNTEYVSELASFTQIEAIQSVSDQMQNIEANSLVGQYVTVTDDDGNIDTGKVDYVYNDEGDLYLSVNGTEYSIDDLNTVVDESYYNAALISQTFDNAVAKLPDVNALTLDDEEAVTTVRSIYDALDSSTKSYISATSLSTLETLEARLKALKNSSSSTDTSSESTVTE